VFPSPNGSPWNADRARHWRKHAFAQAAAHANVPAARPYDLRHSFISLLIAQGATVVEVARQAGHAPTMTLSTYAHLFDEQDGADHRPAEEQIRAARLTGVSQEVPVLCPRRGDNPTTNTDKLLISSYFPKPASGLEPETSSLQGAHLQGFSRECGRFMADHSS
jgi:hypothetical protein